MEPCVAGVAGDGRDGATHMSRAATAGVIPGWIRSVTIYIDLEIFGPSLY